MPPNNGGVVGDDAEAKSLFAGGGGPTNDGDGEAANAKLLGQNGHHQVPPARSSRGDPTTSSKVVAAASSSTTGAHTHRIASAVLVWYLSSFAVIFLNKYILSYQHVDPYYLTTVQMLCMALCGYVRLKFMFRWFSTTNRRARPSSASGSSDLSRDYRVPSVFSNKSNLIVGLLRVLTILFGLVSLNYVAVSFVETVKSSGPLFTVVIAACMLGDRTSLPVLLTLIPIMLGLAICSASELSFNLIGFSAALATNVAECMQFVLSKLILCPDSIALEPAAAENEAVVRKSSLKRLADYLRVTTSIRATVSPLQFEYASAVAACAVQIPLFIIFILRSSNSELYNDAGARKSVVSAREAANFIAKKFNSSSFLPTPLPPHATPTLFEKYLSHEVLFTSILSGLCWHIQSLVSWELMSHVSPVTHAVINVVKRVLTIWLSVMVFGNVVTPGAWMGTALLVAGVFCYNSAKARERRQG